MLQYFFMEWRNQMSMVCKPCFVVIVFMASNIFSSILNVLPHADIIEYRYDLPKNTYHKFCRNVYSQNGEDGLIEQILKELGIRDGFFCEFGASDGKISSNTYHLVCSNHFQGIAIESSESLYQECVQNYREFPKVKVFHGAVLYGDEKNDLNAWLKRGELPYDFDLLSIDIDCDDYYVWENLTEFNPKIVLIETNSSRDPIYEELPGNPSTEYNIDLLREWSPGAIGRGCSFISAVKLGLKKGYIPVSYTGNLLFVRSDLIDRLKEFPYKISSDPYDYVSLYTHLVMWRNKWYTNTALILNTAIRDYFLLNKEKYIDVDWLNKRTEQILNNQNLIF